MSGRRPMAYIVMARGSPCVVPSCFSISEQMCIVSVGVCQDDSEWRTECVDVVECCFTIAAHLRHKKAEQPQHHHGLHELQLHCQPPDLRRVGECLQL